MVMTRFGRQRAEGRRGVGCKGVGCKGVGLGCGVWGVRGWVWGVGWVEGAFGVRAAFKLWNRHSACSGGRDAHYSSCGMGILPVRVGETPTP